LGAIGLPTEDVGRIAVECLEAAGLMVEWDGLAKTSIWVSTATPALRVAMENVEQAIEATA